MKKVVLFFVFLLIFPMVSFAENKTEAEDGVLFTEKLVTIIYESDLRTSITYVYKGTEFKPLEVYSDKYKVKLYDKVGYIRKADARLVSGDNVSGRSYYAVNNGDLLHYVYSDNTGRYDSYVYGPAFKGMEEGVRYYSWDGVQFTNDISGYNYFNYMPLSIPTTYTAKQLDAYIEAMKPDSPLIGTGKYFKDVEEKYGVNAMYLLSHAIHESYWGLSNIARDKNNLFGINAVDSDAYGNASKYNSFKDSIEYAAYFVKTRYLDSLVNTPFYNGAVLGNKGVGMNIYYASDPYWGQKIAGRMYSIDKYLGENEWGKYRLGLSLVDRLNVRSEPDTGAGVQYQYNKNYGLLILGEVKKEDGLWYEVKSDHPNHENAFVYASGDLGQYVGEMLGYENAPIKESPNEEKDSVSAEVLVNHLNVREKATTKSERLYQLNKGDSIQVIDIEKNVQGTWYKFKTDKTNNGAAYVYANGNFGTYVEGIVLADKVIEDSSQVGLDVEQKARILVNHLNVREKASTKSNRLYQLNKDDNIMVIDTESNEQGTWFKIITDRADDGVAYVYANGKIGNYAQLIKRSELELNQKALVLVDHLNVREKATTNSKRLYQVNEGDDLNVVDVVENSQGTWYKFKTDKVNNGFAYVYADGKFGTYVNLK